MQSEDSTFEEIMVIVPKRRNVSGHEAMARIFAFLQAADVDCVLDPSGMGITYGEDAEGAGAEFIQSLINIIDARLTTVPTVEERSEAERLRHAIWNESR